MVVDGEEWDSVLIANLEEETLEGPALPVFANGRLRVKKASDSRYVPRERRGIVGLNDDERSGLERLQPTGLDNPEAVLACRLPYPSKELAFGQIVETRGRVILRVCVEYLPPLLLRLCQHGGGLLGRGHRRDGSVNPIFFPG
jgi:hypothetical protein